MIVFPILAAAIAGALLGGWLAWSTKPPDHDPETCDECRWR